MSLLRRALLLLPPETAHQVAMFLMRGWQMVWVRLFGARLPEAPAVQVRVVPSLRFRGRVGLAAGFDKNAEAFAALARMGFGFIEVGTVTPKAQRGNPRPRIWRRPPDALVNSLGFNNCGLERFRENLRRYRSAVRELPLFANVGKNRDTANENALADYGAGIEALKDIVDGFVLNVSSPNTPGLVTLQSAAFIEGASRLLPEGMPAWLKLSPDLSNDDLRELCRMVRGSRFSGVVVTNTSRTFAERLGHEVGGLSGAPLFERALECVTIARDAVGLDRMVIGVGGVGSVARAKQMRAAGADLVEVYTAFIYQGPALVRSLSSALSS